MAHECPECGLLCHCNGDIDDICFGESDECKCCIDKLDDDDYEDGDNNTPDYYLCSSCGYTCVEKHGGWGCPKCTAIMEEQFY